MDIRCSSLGKESYEKDLLEKDATTLITFWGFTPGYECKQFDYSWREWSGLIKRYYHLRWEMFYDMALAKLEEGHPYVDNAKMNHGREAFRGNAFYDKLADWEIEFVNTPKQDIDAVGTNNEIELAGKFYNKYRELAKLYGVF